MSYIDPTKYEVGCAKKSETLFHCYALLEYIWGKYKIQPKLKYARDGIVGTTGGEVVGKPGSRG